MAPDDPIGTVRATEGVLAVRAPSVNPDYSDDLSWFVVDIGAGQVLHDLGHEECENLLASWPIVYQPWPADR